MTKMFALGALGAGAIGAGVAAVRARRRAAARSQSIDAFDYADLDEPIVVTEEVIVVTDAEPYEARQDTGLEGFEMPGRGAGPR